MKTREYTLDIENFSEWYTYLRKGFSGILGAEYDKQTKTLKIFYEDTATELTLKQLKNLQIPVVLRFKKKLPRLTILNATVIVASENEFVVETFDAESTRKEVRQKYPEFEETNL